MLNGYRNGIMVMRRIAELLEKNPALQRPRVEFRDQRFEHEDGPATYELVCNVLFTISEYPTYSIWDEDERAEDLRARCETRIQDLIAALGPDAAWESNDPSADDYTSKNYFVLTAEVDGCTIKIMCERGKIGEMITVADAGPDVTEVDGAVRVIRQTATMWRPNITLTKAAPVKFELSSGEIRQLTA